MSECFNTENKTYISLITCNTNIWTKPFKCAVSSCSNTFTNEEICPTSYKFHDFPENKEICNLWIKKCDLENDVEIKDLKVCTDHFNYKDYINVKGDFKLKDSSIPHHNLVIENVFDEKTVLLNEKFDALNSQIGEIKLKIHKANQMVYAKKQKILSTKLKITQLKQKPQKELHLIRKIFSESQISYLRGKKTFWNDDDLAMAFTLRHIGTKKFYLYLRNTLNFPLPALSCVQKWIARKN